MKCLQLIIYLLISYILIITNSISLNDSSLYYNQVFRINEYHLQLNYNESLLVELLNDCIANDLIILVIKQIQSYRGSSLLEISQTSLKIPEFFTISHELNKCSSSKYENIINKQEILWQLSLVIWPWNSYTIKNYGFILEWNSKVNILDSLYNDCYYLTNDYGCLIQLLVYSPSQYMNNYLTIISYHRILLYISKYINYIDDYSYNQPDQMIREYQINYQYIGYNPNLISILYSKVINNIYCNYFNSNNNYTNTIESMNHKIKIGIVSEQYINSSPSLCFLIIVQLLHERYYNDFELVYFDRRGDYSSLTDLFIKLNLTIIPLYTTDILTSKQLIIQQNIDILIYLALPTEKFSYLLSQFKCSTIQIQFGIGHPITSGSQFIDYTIIGKNMLYQLDNKYMYSSINQLVDVCINQSVSIDSYCSSYNNDVHRYSSCLLDSYSSDCLGVSHSNHIYYNEQLVVFDSPAYALNDSLDLIESTFDPLEFSFSISCDELANYLIDWNITNLSAFEFGCIDSYLNQFDRKIHIYTCIQLPKKLHPSFDMIIAGIIRNDKLVKLLDIQSDMFTFIIRLSRIVLDIRTKQIMTERLSYYLNLNQIDKHIIYLSRLSHTNYLKLLALSDVFLTTYPFGAGITSSDAISVCLPIVILPKRIEILQLTYAQIIELDPQLVDFMVANNESDYISKAIGLANGGVVINNIYHDKLSLRKHMCEKKRSYFHSSRYDDVIHEWAMFMKRIFI